VAHIWISLLLIYRPRKDKRLSRPSCWPYIGWFTHISGHPSATGRAWDRKSSPVSDRRSTTEPRNQNTQAKVRKSSPGGRSGTTGERLLSFRYFDL